MPAGRRRGDCRRRSDPDLEAWEPAENWNGIGVRSRVEVQPWPVQSYIGFYGCEDTRLRRCLGSQRIGRWPEYAWEPEGVRILPLTGEAQ
jgi:hypothetical protein